MIIALLIMKTLRYGTEEFDWWECAEVSGGGSECFGISSGLRASFSLCMFHIIVLVAIFPRAACSSALHDGFWGVKYIILIAFYIVSYFIPYKFYDTWGGICLIFSFFFLVIQGYFILNLAYTWNDLLMDAMNGRDGSSYAQFLLLCYSSLNAVGVVVWLVFQFIWFTPEECDSGLPMF
jgi:hypothetical protein